MKRSWHKVNNRKMYLEQYDSYIEFWNDLQKRDKEGAFRKYATEDKNWSGIGSVEQAKDLLLNGWDKPVDKIKENLSKEIDKLLSDRVKMTMFNDVTGYIVNVPNAIMGLPKSMINVSKQTKKQRVIKFLIDSTVNCGVSSDELTDKYTKIVARIAVLEKMGYRCRIEMFEQYAVENSEKTIVAKCIKVKDEKQPFDIKRMSFVISHVGFFRVFGFTWEDVVKDTVDYSDYHCWGLGHALYYWGEDEKNQVINNTRNINEKCIYINYKSNLDEIFGKGDEIIG